MSAPQWKPGDVAMIGSSIAFRTDREWRYRDGSSHSVEIADAFDYTRPLVIIDPEDPDQVWRLIKAYWAYGTDDCNDLDAMTRGLRSLVADPKPGEPQGLGAVVEDADGRCWTRYRQTTTIRHWFPADGVGDGRRWVDFPAVRVLSEGWLG